MKLMARSQIPLKLKPDTQPQTLKARYASSLFKYFAWYISSSIAH